VVISRAQTIEHVQVFGVFDPRESTDGILEPKGPAGLRPVPDLFPSPEGDLAGLVPPHTDESG